MTVRSQTENLVVTRTSAPPRRTLTPPVDTRMSRRLVQEERHWPRGTARARFSEEIRGPGSRGGRGGRPEGRHFCCLWQSDRHFCRSPAAAGRKGRGGRG